MRKEYLLNINGFEMNVSYEERAIEEIFLPLLREWTKLQEEKQKRILIFLSAPPGTGKSTLSLFLEYLSKTEEDVAEIQAIGLDGFHFHQDYLETHQMCVNGEMVPMKNVKGCLETFDIEKLLVKLKQLKEADTMWPIYDRNLHDVVEDVVQVTKDIVLIEGNWLLSNEGAWKKLKDWCDDSIFISAEVDDLAERLITRKMKGGLSREDAEVFYHNSDKKNVERVLANHHPARVTLCMKNNDLLLTFPFMERLS